MVTTAEINGKIPIRCPLLPRRASGETGRRAGLRIQWGNPWEFKSPLAHQTSSINMLGLLSRHNRNTVMLPRVLVFGRFVLVRDERSLHPR
jgi:hypothetical protein